jgi:hypothetical protein
MADDKSNEARSPGTETYWRLLAIGLDPDKATPDLYTLVFVGEHDVPLMADSKIVFFTDPQKGAALLAAHGAAHVADHVDIEKPTMWCDVAQALHYLDAGGIDADSSVLNAVNALLDLVRATGIAFTERRKKALYAIADYCTFRQDLTAYLEVEGDYSSRELVDAVLWCVGAIVVKSTVV